MSTCGKIRDRYLWRRMNKMSKILVAYFSASGMTAKLSANLANAIGADLYEINTVKPYTIADLDWMNKQSRSSVEMKDKSSRPEIANKVEDMGKYDTVFVGFPIWWYREPSIIDTFMESYDFTGKTIIPFATSGGSGLGETSKNLEELAKAAKVLEGKRFSPKAGEEELRNWAGEFI